MIIHESIYRNKFAQEQYFNNPNKDNLKNRNKPITKKTKQNNNTNIHENEAQNMRYEVRK